MSIIRQLFYVIGPSGAGKDSLMLVARQTLDGEAIAFAHRYITRASDAGGENYVSLTQAEFAVRQLNGCFWFAWTSHDLHYAIGCEVLSWLQAGLTVVVNGSREYLPKAQQLCAQSGVRLVPVWVHCDRSVLAQRLIARGRETRAQIDERLARAAQFVVPDDALVINNSGTLQQALAQWLPVLQQAIDHA